MSAQGVLVAAYDPAWPEDFESLRDLLARTLGPAAVGIEHVGSTSVTGLAARPVIDIDVALADFSRAHELRQALEAAGFTRDLAGDLADRQWYRRAEAGHPSCHLSLTYSGSRTWRSHLALRDALRTDPAATREFGDLKRRIAAEGDARTLATAKAAFIDRFLGDRRAEDPGHPRVSRRLLVLGGLAIAGGLAVAGAAALLASFAETSRGPDGLPDHRPVRASDLAARAEGSLFYPGSTALRHAQDDQSADPNNPASGPAEIDDLLVTAADPDAVRTWYQQRLAGSGWALAPSNGEAPPGVVQSEWRRGRHEYFDLRLYVDRASLGSQNFAVPGLIYRVVYEVTAGH